MENVVALRQTSALASPAGTASSGRFCAWRGASDRRYVTTVHPVDHGHADLGLPDFECFILLAVSRGPSSRQVQDVAVVGPSLSRRATIATGLARGANEWHVLVIAQDPVARTAALADLRARHVRLTPEALCA